MPPVAPNNLNYLQICNRVLNRFNEVQLTVSNFNTAVGFQQAVKEAVLDSVSDILQEEYTWPFLHSNGSQILLTDGTQRYSFPVDFSTADWNSFFLNRNDILTPPVVGKPIYPINYDRWLSKLRDRDVAMNASNYSTPDFVVQTQDNPNQFLITPPSAQAYTVSYEYYISPVDMAASTDIPIIYPKYQSVIIDGAHYYTLLWRDNAPEAKQMLEQFQAGIKQMRTELINREDRMENDVLPHGGGVARSFGYGFGF